MRIPIITTLLELSKYIELSGSKSYCEYNERRGEIGEQIFIQDGPKAGIIYVLARRTPHHTRFDVEINYDHPEQFIFHRLTMQQVLLLLKYEEII